MGQIQTYPFALLFLLKRPPVSFKSTRNPQPFKINYSLVQILAHSPLTFLELVPAVQLLFFYALDPRINVYLRFSPQFLQKTPCNLVFLANKPLNLVLGLVYAF